MVQGELGQQWTVPRHFKVGLHHYSKKKTLLRLDLDFGEDPETEPGTTSQGWAYMFRGRV